MTGLFAVAHASLDRYRSVWFRHGRGSSKIDVVVAASTGEASGRGRGEEVRKVRLLRKLGFGFLAYSPGSGPRRGGGRGGNLNDLNNLNNLNNLTFLTSLPGAAQGGGGGTTGGDIVVSP